MESIIRRWIDVREPSEFASGHIQGSELVPLAILSRECGMWDKRQPLMLVCRSGQRAEKACAVLAAKQFKDVAVLPGGVLRWRAEGKSLTVADGDETANIRWVRVMLGIVILVSLGLAHLVSPWFLVVTGIAGVKLLSGRSLSSPT